MPASRYSDDWYFEHVLLDASPGPPARLVQGPAARWRQWWQQQAASSDVLKVAATQGFVLGVSDRHRLGISERAMRTAVQRSRWLHPARGVIAPLTVAGGSHHLVSRRRHALVAAAAVLNRPGYVVSGRSAAILHGLPTMNVAPRPELTGIDEQRLGSRSGAHVLGARLPLDAVTWWYGVPVTSIPRTLVDLARRDRRDALMAADAALYQRLVTMADIESELGRAAGWPGVAQARNLLALAIEKAESPLESLTRLALYDSGFPMPEPQYEIAGYRVDLCWPDRRLVIEADGREKYSNDALWEEKKRETQVRKYGYRVERVIWSDVVSDWPSTCDRIRATWNG